MKVMVQDGSLSVEYDLPTDATVEEALDAAIEVLTRVYSQRGVLQAIERNSKKVESL